LYLLFLALFFLCGFNACKKKGFSLIGYWDFYLDNRSVSVRFEFSGTETEGTVLEVGVLPGYQKHTYAVNSAQIIIKFYSWHGIAWSRSTYSGQIKEEEDRMTGTYSGQSGGTPTDPVYDFSGTWSAIKIQ
jgi:hypothetical protein